MSFQYSKIKSQYILPTVDIKNYRTEFHLEGTGNLYMSNMRIGNVGLFGVDDVHYNRLGGVNSLINSITLYNGSEILSQSLNHKNQSAYKQMFGSSNDLNHSKNHEQVGCNNAYAFKQVKTDLTNSLRAITLANQRLEATEMPTKVAEVNSSAGIIHVNQHLPLLRSLPSISSDVFSNLRLVIVWNTNYSEMLQDITDIVSWNTQKPVLIVEEIFDEALKQKHKTKSKTVQWFEVENDVVDMPADATALVDTVYRKQDMNVRVNGFNKKYVNSVWVKTNQTNAYTTDGTDIEGFGYLGSNHQLRASYNLRVNSSPVVPRDGLNKTSYRLRQLAHRYPGATSYPTMNTLPTSSVVVVDGGDAHLKSSQGDWMYLDIQKRIQDLQFVFERQHQLDGNNLYNQPLKFDLFATVAKQIIIKNGLYVIAYV